MFVGTQAAQLDVSQAARVISRALEGLSLGTAHNCFGALG